MKRLLLLIPLAFGCVPGLPVWSDAGAPDAGRPDARHYDLPDAHTHLDPPEGTYCINNNSGQLEQSTCASGLLCLPLSQENTTLTICSKECSSDTDCGVSRNGVANVCWDGICWQGCDTSGGNCNQSDFNCQPYSGDRGICRPDCSQQAASFCTEFRGYPLTVCDLNSGNCTTGGGTCGPAMACPSGQTCDVLPTIDGGPQESRCVADCTTFPAATCRNNTECKRDNCIAGHCAPCPSGYVCDETAKSCEIVPVANYGLCVPSLSGACPTGDCINFGNGEGACLPPCTADAMCPAGGNATPRCALDLNDGSKVCALDCSAPDAGCPADTACATIAGLGSFCFPSPGSH